MDVTQITGTPAPAARSEPRPQPQTPVPRPSPRQEGVQHALGEKGEARERGEAREGGDARKAGQSADNKALQSMNRHVSFVVNQGTGQVAIRILDSETNEVVREIPPEEIQRLQARIRELQGLLFDRRA